MLVGDFKRFPEMTLCLFERINTEAFCPSDNAVLERFGWRIRAPIMISKVIRDFAQAIAASAFNFCSGFQMKGCARDAQESVVKRVSHKRVFEDVVARLVILIYEVERPHRGESRIDVVSRAAYRGQKIGIEAPSDYRGGL